MIDWRPDVLGDGFECTDIDLGHDSEGPLGATLVRSLPDRLGLWERLLGRERNLEHLDVLYVHGWNDYFFQKDLARFYTSRGARFFALDLRKYGRSLREGQTYGYIEDLKDYDAEIHAAIGIIHGDHDKPDTRVSASVPQRKLLLLGHSTGGLVLTLWAARNHGVADALLMNSPWLDLQISGALRLAIVPVIQLQARHNPHEITLPKIDQGFYAQAQRANVAPEELAAINQEWRPEHSMPVRAGWLRAIIAGHETISSGIDVGAPVCTLLSAKSEFNLSWNEAMLRADTVLDVDAISRAVLKIGPSVTIERIDGALHDVFLSESRAREQAYQRMEAWLVGWRANW